MRLRGGGAHHILRAADVLFQPSFKLAAKQRDGAKVAKRYDSPQARCERLLQAETIPMATKSKLRAISAELDPLRLLEEMRAVQCFLAALADSETPPTSAGCRCAPRALLRTIGKLDRALLAQAKALSWSKSIARCRAFSRSFG
jgi:hypothetical protein